jgi:hypothetical protein
MRRLILSVLFVTATSGAALAVGFGWHGPGWYVVKDTPMKNQALYRGAYKTQDECMADKPADTSSIQYECVKFDNEPMDN